MNGKYNIVLRTPMGDENGMIIFNTNSNPLSGNIIARGINNPFSGGRVVGKKFEFSGSIRIMMMRISYNASGSIEGGGLSGVVKTKYGNFAFNGSKIS